MKIQFMSDLHLEFPENRRYLANNSIHQSGDILILAGDIISSKYKIKAEPFYAEWRRKFKLIISAFGNHEFYHDTIDYAYLSYKKELSENHLLLNNSSVVFENTRFIVSTLWSHIPEEAADYIENRVTDYMLIHKKIYGETAPVLSKEINIFHSQSVRYIEQELSKQFTGRTVVVTHHLPDFTCLASDDLDDYLKYAYASGLNYLFEKYKIDLWICGHQHTSIDMNICGTMVVSNPLGYVIDEPNKKFISDSFIEM